MNAETHAAQPRLMHLPVSLFAMVMGLSGLTLATLRFEHASGAAGAGIRILKAAGEGQAHCDGDSCKKPYSSL